MTSHFTKIVTYAIFLCKKVPFCFVHIVFSLIFATEKSITMNYNRFLNIINDS